MEDKEPGIIVCSPTKWGGKGKEYIPGSTTAHCDECGQEISIAPSSLALKEQNPHYKIMCAECVVPRMKDDDDIKINPFSDQQKEELITAFKRLKEDYDREED